MLAVFLSFDFHKYLLYQSVSFQPGHTCPKNYCFRLRIVSLMLSISLCIICYLYLLSFYVHTFVVLCTLSYLNVNLQDIPFIDVLNLSFVLFTSQDCFIFSFNVFQTLNTSVRPIVFLGVWRILQ